MRVAFMFPAAIVLGAGLARGVEPPTAQMMAVSDLASLREGVFTTAPAPGNPEEPARVRVLFDLAKRVDVPALGRDVVYAELRETSPEGPILRQSLLALSLDPEAGRIVMVTYRLGHAPELAGAYANPAPLAVLRLSDVKLQRVRCDIIWRKTADGFEGDDAPGCGPPRQGHPADLPVMTASKTELTEPVDDAADVMYFRRLR
jgi:hypothetical protein